MNLKETGDCEALHERSAKPSRGIMCGHEKLNASVVFSFFVCICFEMPEGRSYLCASSFSVTKQRWACGVAPKCPIIPCVFFWFGISVSEQSIEHWTQQFCTTATYHITSIRPLLALSVRPHSVFQKELSWLKTNSGGRCVLVRGCRAGNQSDIVLCQTGSVWCVNGRGAIFPVTSQCVIKVIFKLS